MDQRLQTMQGSRWHAPSHRAKPCCDVQDSVTSVVVRGWEITAGSVDGTVRRFDVRMGRVYVDELHQPVTSVAVSRDGLCTLAACLDSTLRLLDKASGQLLASYKGHMHQAVKMDCCFTPSDAQVVGSSETGEAPAGISQVVIEGRIPQHRQHGWQTNHQGNMPLSR